MDLSILQQEYIDGVNSGQIKAYDREAVYRAKKAKEEEERLSILLNYIPMIQRNPINDLKDEIEELKAVIIQQQETKPIMQSETTEKGKAGRQSDDSMNEELKRIIDKVGSKPIDIINEIVRLANDQDAKGKSFHGWEVKNYHNGKYGIKIKQENIKGTASFNTDSEITLTIDAVRKRIKRMQN